MATRFERRLAALEVAQGISTSEALVIFDDETARISCASRRGAGAMADLPLSRAEDETVEAFRLRALAEAGRYGSRVHEMARADYEALCAQIDREV